MDYRRIYDTLIENARRRDNLDGYYEIHHIIPKSLGGKDDESNLVKLTLKEHYFAHELLVEIYPNNKQLACALWIMTVTTLGSLKRSNDIFSLSRSNRDNSFFETYGKKLRISSNEYEYARRKYRESKINKVYTDEEKKNVSIGTKKAMRNKDVIEKCIMGSKGCKFYRSKIDGSVHKWFPGDKDIDLSIYEWGRQKMSDEQKHKISEANKLSKKYFIIPEINSKYTLYDDYVNLPPSNWKEKWTNESNRLMKKYIIEAVRKFDIETNYIHEHSVIYQVPNKSKNFRIITPSLYICCSDVIKKWRKENIVNELSNRLKEEIFRIKELNKVYMKL